MLGEAELAQFILACQARGLATKTLGDYANELDKLIEWCGKHHVSPIELSRTDIGQYIRRTTTYGKPPKPGTVNQRLTVIKSLYRWLWEEELIPNNTAARVRSVKVPTRHPRPIPHEDWLKLWAAAVGERQRAALVLTYYCGVRGDEIRSLHTVQIGRNTIQDFKRKGGEKVILPWRKMIVATAHGLPQTMPLNVSEVFEALMRVKKFATIWPTGAGREWLRDQYNDLAANAGLSHINPHRGRASAASNMLRAGVPIQHVKFLLDISRWETLQHYVESGRMEFNEWFDRWYGHGVEE